MGSLARFGRGCVLVPAAAVLIAAVVSVFREPPGKRLHTGSTESRHYNDFRSSGEDSRREEAIVATPRGLLTVPGLAVLDGRDEAAGAIVWDINIWATADRTPLRPLFSLPHGSLVRVLGVQQEERMMFLVKSNRRRGWVSELFVAPPQ